MKSRKPTFANQGVRFEVPEFANQGVRFEVPELQSVRSPVATWPRSEKHFRMIETKAASKSQNRN